MQPEVLVLLEKTVNIMENLGFLWIVHTGLKLDLWVELQEEKSLEQLLTDHPDWDRVLLDHWLEQAYILSLLDKKGSAYRATKLGKAVETYRRQGLEAMYQEFIVHWNWCFAGLPELITKRVSKAHLGSEMEEELISRASLASEMFAWPVLMDKCKREKWHSVLDVGCGEGTYLHNLVETFPEIQAVGIEINPKVALRALSQAAKYHGRLRIICADALELDANLGKFDVCLLNNNIYYFSVEQRGRLVNNIKQLLNPGGQIAILTALRESDYTARIFRTHIPQNLMSFFLACHHGFNGLPRAEEIVELLKSAGLEALEVKPLAMQTSYYFFGKRSS